MSSRFLLAVLAVLMLSHGIACSQSWPNRPVRIIVPFPAGGAVNVLARTVFDKVSAQVSQPFVIENRLGAGGTIGSAAVAKAESGRVHHPGQFLLAHRRAGIVCKPVL